MYLGHGCVFRDEGGQLEAEILHADSPVPLHSPPLDLGTFNSSTGLHLSLSLSLCVEMENEERERSSGGYAET